MAERFLRPFVPIRPQDNPNLARFNALTWEALGMHPDSLKKTTDEEWQDFEIHAVDAEPYYATFDAQRVAVAVRLRYLKNGKILEVASLAVASELRNRGLGSRAISELVDLGRDRNANLLSLNSLSTAEPFYEQNGFIHVGSEGGNAYMQRILHKQGVAGLHEVV